MLAIHSKGTLFVKIETEIYEPSAHRTAKRVRTLTSSASLASNKPTDPLHSHIYNHFARWRLLM